MATVDFDLKIWAHPSMNLPFQLGEDNKISISGEATVMELMEKTEFKLENRAKEMGNPMQCQLQVVWNLKTPNKAMNPSTKVKDSLESGDTFGVHGDIMPISVSKPQRLEEEKIPVTILTGFLGSGKTTLLNYILQEQKDLKIAVIENEFGEVSIDDSLLKKDKLALAEKVVVMDNGCMCCTVRGDLAAGLNSIMEEVNQGKTIDAIIIETTGMADPVPIVRTFMTNQEISSDIRLDSVVALADAKHIIGRLDDKVEEGKVNEAYQQVAFCDRMILNKLDLVTPEEAIRVQERLRSINAFAKILPAIKSRVKVSELTNLRAHDMANFVNEDIEKESEMPAGHGEVHGGGHGDVHGGGHDNGDDAHAHGASGHGDAHGSGHGGGHISGHGPPSKKSRHDSRVNSFSIVREGEILPEKLGKFMSSLGQLDAEKGTIFRIKGILAVKNHPFKHVFHAVMDVSDEDDAGPWGDEKRISKIVFIGKGLDQKFIRDGWDDIFEKQ